MNIFDKNKKKILIGVLIIIVIGLVIFIILNNNKNKDKNNSKNNDKPIVENIEVESKGEITVIGSRIEKLGNLSNIFVKIQNNTGNDIDKCDLRLTAFDKDNNMILESYVRNFKDFKEGAIEEFQVTSTNDLSNASKYVVEKINK